MCFLKFSCLVLTSKNIWQCQGTKIINKNLWWNNSYIQKDSMDTEKGIYHIYAAKRVLSMKRIRISFDNFSILQISRYLFLYLPISIQRIRIILVSWFYGTLTLVELFNTEIIFSSNNFNHMLMNTASRNYFQYKQHYVTFCFLIIHAVISYAIKMNSVCVCVCV